MRKNINQRKESKRDLNKWKAISLEEDLVLLRCQLRCEFRDLIDQDIQVVIKYMKRYSTGAWVAQLFKRLPLAQVMILESWN